LLPRPQVLSPRPLTDIPTSAGSAAGPSHVHLRDPLTRPRSRRGSARTRDRYSDHGRRRRTGSLTMNPITVPSEAITGPGGHPENPVIDGRWAARQPGPAESIEPDQPGEPQAREQRILAVIDAAEAASAAVEEVLRGDATRRDRADGAVNAAVRRCRLPASRVLVMAGRSWFEPFAAAPGPPKPHRRRSRGRVALGGLSSKAQGPSSCGSFGRQRPSAAWLRGATPRSSVARSRNATPAGTRGSGRSEPRRNP
jgi:hypothetical protein